MTTKRSTSGPSDTVPATKSPENHVTDPKAAQEILSSIALGDTSCPSHKTEYQIMRFLANFRPKTPLDGKFIESYMTSEFKTSRFSGLSASLTASNPLDVQSFTQWLENGFCASEIAFYKSDLVILGNCALDEARISGILSAGGERVEKADLSVSPSDLGKVDDPGQIRRFMRAMRASSLQLDEKTLELVPKYYPQPNEKVIFHNRDLSVTGLGVVRQCYADTGEVELYCYYVYPTVRHKALIGYSMHETGVADLDCYVFEDMLDDGNRSSSLNGVSCLRRMNRELERHGKVWKDKLHRIEPLEPKVKRGEKYWYITDKMKVVSDRDTGNPTAHQRYLAGNYFTDEEAAFLVYNDWMDRIHRYLASDDWPNIVR